MIYAFSFYSVLSHHPGGLNDHPIVEEYCHFLEDQKSQVSFYLSFLVDRMEEQMKANPSLSKELLPKADQVLVHFVSDVFFLLNKFFSYIFYSYFSHLPRKWTLFVENTGYFFRDILIPNSQFDYSSDF